MTLLPYDQAIAVGAKTFQGAPCRHGHAGERYTRKGRNCVDCERARDRLKYEQNKDAENARKRRWYHSNKEHIGAYNVMRYQREGRDAHRTRIYSWRQLNPDKVRDHKRISSATRRALTDQPISVKTLRAIAQLQGGRCAYCGSDADLHLDHIQALSRGGTNAASNLQLLCAWHNMSKNAMPCHEYRAKHGIPALTPWDVRAGILQIALEP